MEKNKENKSHQHLSITFRASNKRKRASIRSRNMPIHVVESIGGNNVIIVSVLAVIEISSIFLPSNPRIWTFLHRPQNPKSLVIPIEKH